MTGLRAVAVDALGGSVLGAPGVYVDQVVVPPARLSTEPMDVAAFAGIAPRGPAWERMDDPTLAERGPFRSRSVAVPVDSWDDYVHRYGGLAGPGLLPQAVATFFAQGGRRAYVVRVVDAAGGADGGRAAFDLGGTIRLLARDQGSWGNRLRTRLSFTARPIAAVARPPDRMVLEPGGAVPVGATVRIRTGPVLRLATVVRVARQRPPAGPGTDLVSTVDGGIAAHPAFELVATLDGDVAADWTFELVEAELAVEDPDPVRSRKERFPALGLAPGHPRFLPDVLAAESRLVEADGSVWLPAPALPVLTGALDRVGEDRWHRVLPEDLFARPGEPAGTGGIDALAEVAEVALLVVPDLYAPGGADPVAPPRPSPGSPAFAVCAPRPAPVPDAPPARGLDLLRLDPAEREELAEIVKRQQRLVAAAEEMGIVALLDVPPGLRPDQLRRWRSSFDSPYAAAYHPWLRGNGTVPPSAAAAGVIARCELRDGVCRGPANEVVDGIVAVAAAVDDALHAELHWIGVDVFRQDPDGVRLTGARTLSVDPAWRQLSVRRLVSMVERAVRRQLQWTVFEPNDAALRDSLRVQLDALLAERFEQGCFAGGTPETSWFVHVAGGAQARAEADRGQLVVEVGLAPATPLEFLVLRVAVQAEGTISTTVTARAGERP